MADDKKELKPKQHHARTRRDFVKRVAAGTVALAGATQLPKKWTKPVVDSVIVPVHAQATVLGTITPTWILGDDAPGGLAGITTGTTNVTDGFLYDDGTDMSFLATLAPPAAVLVSINVNRTNTTYGGDDYGTTSNIASADSGNVTFGTFAPPNDDFGDNPGNGSIVVTFSAPGYANSVITLSIVSPP